MHCNDWSTPILPSVNLDLLVYVFKSTFQFYLVCKWVSLKYSTIPIPWNSSFGFCNRTLFWLSYSFAHPPWPCCFCQHSPTTQAFQEPVLRSLIFSFYFLLKAGNRVFSTSSSSIWTVLSLFSNLLFLVESYS